MSQNSTSNSNFFVDLIEYFRNKAKSLQSLALEASIHDNKGDIGTLREDILFDFDLSVIDERS